MKKFLFFIQLFLLGISSYAQDRKELNTANMSRAIEAFSNGDVAEMNKWLNSEISNNPQNGYAYSWLAYLFNYYEEYGYAISAADKAIQYIPKRDKEYIVFAYSSRANAHLGLGNKKNALLDWNTAIRFDPKNSSLYHSRGNFYYEQSEYALSDKDYQKYITMEPSDPLGYMGLGRNELERGHFEEAIAQFNKALQLRSSDYSKGYGFRAECYLRLGRFDEAASDIVNALDIDSDNKAYHLMLELADSSYRTIASRLRVQSDKEPNNSEWQYYLGAVSEIAKKYEKSIEFYNAGYQVDGNTAFLDRISRIYRKTGNLSAALRYANEAIERDSSDLDYRTNRVAVNYELDDMSAVIKDLDYCIAQNDRNLYWYYYRRGWYKELMGDTEGAIDDYTSSITIYPDYAYVYVSRGKLLLSEGEKSAARKDFHKCIALDTVDMSNISCAFYAFHYLDDDKNAVRLLDTMLSHGGSIYDAVCLYSLMGEKDKAIDYLRKALEDGYNNFTHIERDNDLDNIRNEKSFIDLVSEHKSRWQQKNNMEGGAAPNIKETVCEVPFTKKNGITEVKCSINGLPLYFIFDTGAGDVTISSVEAAFMFKNGYLSEKDVIGRSLYRTASGDIIEGTVINLDKVEIGEMILNNVRASVVRGQSAPLLLGQSVLSRLGKIEIDNPKKVIKITYHE